jgi:hypothetical protein
MNAHVGKIPEFGGMNDKVSGPEFATAVGLMSIDLDSAPVEDKRRLGKGLFSNLLARFKKR